MLRKVNNSPSSPETSRRHTNKSPKKSQFSSRHGSICLLIPVFRLRWEDFEFEASLHHKFENNLSCILRPCREKKNASKMEGENQPETRMSSVVGHSQTQK